MSDASGWLANLSTSLGGFELDVVIEGGSSGTLALIGPNGSGKTTFLRALLGAIPSKRAHIVVSGRVLESTEAGVCLPIEQRRVGYVPQGYGLFPRMSALENVAFGLSVGEGALPRARREEKALELLDVLGSSALAERRVGSLSGGERQRVALARALIIEPSMLLLDEPLAALDPTTRRKIRASLARRLEAFGAPVIMVTHDARDVVALDARVCVLDQGRVVQTGALDEVRQTPATPFVEEFFALERPT
jgi:ABC-type sulfate/molybdate transport systems ATPase subunit